MLDGIIRRRLNKSVAMNIANRMPKGHGGKFKLNPQGEDRVLVDVFKNGTTAKAVYSIDGDSVTLISWEQKRGK